MKSATLALSLLASIAIAQPHGHHHGNRRNAHGHHHNKRALVTEWVTETVYETVTKIVDETTTQIVGPATVPTTTGHAPAEFFEPPPSQVPEVPPAPSSSAKAPPPPPPVKPVPTTTAAPPPPPPPPVETPVVETPVVETPETKPVVPKPDPTTVLATPSAKPSTKPESGNGGGGGGKEYHGDLTHYTVGLGACGFDDGGKDRSENIVALSHLLMGTQSNGNPYCDKTVTITANGKSITGVVRDKCMGCAMENIDVSEKMFLELFGDLGVGRDTVTWHFNN